MSILKKIQKSRLRLKVGLVVLITLSGLFSIIPLKLAIALHQAPEPEAILVLGSAPSRMRFAAQFSHSHPTLEIWVSDYYSNFAANQLIFRQNGVRDEQVHYNFYSTDTVTNFTSTVEDFMAQDIHHLYLITSEYHMARSRAIATLVLGSRGIAITPISVSSKGRQPESTLRIVRDCIRCLVWIVTGRTGASFNPDIKVNNSNQIRA
ncbi:MAG: YdcF family protein [Symploca sp. SIO2C1]|nr:YdcF family protein [Symploca sp. SIO2C1]